MHRKLPKLLVFFLALLILNFNIVSVVHAKAQRTKKITVILEEFENIELAAGDQNVLGALDVVGDEVTKDARVATLKAFFRRHDSPLYDYSEYIVTTSDKYGLDFRLIPAISMQESTACKVIPHGSHNCWGWGIYGGKITRFASYDESIETVAKGLKINYIDKGLVTPDEIMSKYNPTSAANGGSWANGVNTFFGVLEE